MDEDSQGKKQVDYDAMLKCFNKLLEMGGKAWQALQSLRSHTFEELTYEDVIEELVKNKPSDTNIAKGAALKRTLNDKLEITILYLDKNNEPVWGDNPKKPYGCIKRTRKLNPELAEFFSDKDLIIFE